MPIVTVLPAQPSFDDLVHLRSADWLWELPDEERGRMFKESTCHEHPRGATIFSPTLEPHSLYLLERGRVRIYRLSDGGDEATFGYVAPGEVFGELTAFGDFPRESFAVAVSASKVWRIPATAFRQALQTRPTVILAITQQIGQRLKRIESRVENLVFRDALARVARILLELSEDFGRTDGNMIALDLDLTQFELSTLVGSTRQTVNVCLRDLERAGVIEHSGRRLIIRDEAELARIGRPASSED